jgi:hypothetical protein
MQTHSVACLVALVGDHPTRGTKSILRYGWSLQDLASDSAGTFVENSKKVARTPTRLGEMVASFHLVTLETAELPRDAITSRSPRRRASTCAVKKPSSIRLQHSAPKCALLHQREEHRHKNQDVNR